ncbi:sensor histidine kinase [Streptomyces gamaensis]|uniref:Sensor histidine kinase n=1 Tax=Streptomyces gamaensis TaxID=1763542 RepID=A0ABW0YVM3_9ACTN
MTADEPRRQRWRERLLAEDDLTADSGLGRPPETRRQAMVKLMWVCIWFAYLGEPVSDLLGGHHTLAAVLLGALGLLAYLGVYLALIFRRTMLAMDGRVFAPLGFLLGTALVLTLTLGYSWLVLFVYVSVAASAVLPMRLARLAILLVTGLLLGIGMTAPGAGDFLPWLVLPTLLGGAAMAGVRQMARTARALREARATVAHLAANEERLRLARDLHDLLGHSLSLITLKSELAGRMLPDRPEQAAQQVADIEKVSRQALVDVREAVSGFRRPTLGAELAGARTALTAAGIAAAVAPFPERHPDLPAAQEGALAWALREAVTNAVRHSGARRCELTLTEESDELCLTVTDDGKGPAGPHGNGLTGLAERLALADGRLETGPGPRGGFRLRAYVPLSRAGAAPEQQDPAPPVGSC